MKARFHPIVLSLVIGLVAWLRAPGVETTAVNFVYMDPSDPAMDEVRTAGERAIEQIGGALFYEVRQVMAKATPAVAVGTMHLKNYALPDSSDDTMTVTGFRLTSLRVRNPANAPDAAELDALNVIRRQLENGDTVAKALVQQVTQSGQPTEWRVYRPLAVLKQCTACHGPVNAMDPGMAAAVHALFPEDAATNYRHGEWRGLIRVSIAPPLTRK